MSSRLRPIEILTEDYNYVEGDCLEEFYYALVEGTYIECHLYLSNNMPEIQEKYFKDIFMLFDIPYKRPTDLNYFFDTWAFAPKMFITLLRYGTTWFLAREDALLFLEKYHSYSPKTEKQVWFAFQMAAYHVDLFNSHGVNPEMSISFAYPDYRHELESFQENYVIELISYEYFREILLEDFSIPDIERKMQQGNFKQAKQFYRKLCGNTLKSVFENSEYAGNSC